MTLYSKIYEVVQKIPRGCVTSYGKVAKVVGTGPRQVGYAMAAIPVDQDVPWHRVVNSKGEISERKNGSGDSEQRARLTAEGVAFDKNGRINLDQFGWAESEMPSASEIGKQAGLEDWPDDFPQDLLPPEISESSS